MHCNFWVNIKFCQIILIRLNLSNVVTKKVVIEVLKHNNLCCKKKARPWSDSDSKYSVFTCCVISAALGK